MYLLTAFLCDFLRGECLSPIAHGMLFSRTLWNQYQPLLINAGKAQNYKTLQLCGSWQGNHSDITEQQKLLFYIIINIVK